MAILNVDVGDSDVVIDGTDTSDADNTINITALGSHSLTVDGVSASIETIVPVGIGSSPTFAAINGGNLSIDYGSIGASVLSGVTYEVGDTSSISVEGPDLLGLSLGTQTVNFSGSGAGSFSYQNGLIDTVTSMNVTGFSWGDSLAVDGYNFGDFTYDSGTGSATLTFEEGGLLGGSFTYNLENISPELAAAIVADPESFFVDGEFVAPVCFFKGSLIQTDRGPVAVEHIQVGDKVQGLGGLREVRWVGYRHDWIRRIPEASRIKFWPIVISKDAIAPDVPNADLRVSPWHHLYVDGVLVRANDLVNDKTIFRDRTAQHLSYYHVELESFDVIEAQGLYSETYTDGGNREFFQNTNVTQLTPDDRIRRKGDRPGFHAVREKDLRVALRKRYEQRADMLLAKDAPALRQSA
ncbi:hypothetical protein V473_20180 [Sphingobium cupriresistens LL01]|uniref:Hedgehog/Intein (Hint) domain-containing protein n=2 Tax=Sphingobium cupriresistens TaxID=1132417 RepID=A0A0J7XQQ1_9SPHN|nr:Hint domain-containing protein [Sphingobium sp.]KMS53393.1 hypothetical protein V473_20180 [Sphingobium cupriresistens LL01]MBJ7375238.1 Hint domain-containing protein [Sphingobium sp.]